MKFWRASYEGTVYFLQWIKEEHAPENLKTIHRSTYKQACL
jgi:hypothetical protein